ncbi:MAG: EcsC family protein, partial [Proteobacteria bacterium]
LQCVYVFTLGSTRPGEIDSSSYLASRVAFANIIREAATYVGQFTARELFTAVEKGTAPIFARFLAQVAARFEVAVTEKLLASAIPVAGAVGGAAINAAFCDYYVSAARFHFGLLHLERLHGSATVQKAFASATSAASKKSARA